MMFKLNGTSVSASSSAVESDPPESATIILSSGSKTLSFTLTKPKLMESTTINIGDCVVLTVPEGNVLHSAWQVYLLPVFGLFSFSALGQWLLQESILSHELVGVALGLVGGYLGYRIAKRLQSNPGKQKSLQPEILKVLAKPIDVNTLSSD